MSVESLTYPTAGDRTLGGSCRRKLAICL